MCFWVPDLSNADCWSSWGSSLLGSLVAGILSALVALLVVWLTNRSQSKSAQRALAAQEKLLRSEIVEARESSDRAALGSAIAGYLANAERFASSPAPTRQETNMIVLAMNKHYYEMLVLGAFSDGLTKALAGWSDTLRDLQFLAILGTVVSRNPYGDIQVVTKLLCDTLPGWVNGDREERQRIEHLATSERDSMRSFVSDHPS